MAGDIHVALEGRPLGESDWWPLATNMYIMRNYPLFSALAGVRNEYNVVPVAEPRGLPTDLTTQTQEFYQQWVDDAHSASWLTYAEFIRAVELSQAIRRYAHSDEELTISTVDHWMDISLQAVVVYLALYEANQFETRVVFFFDN